MTPQDPLYPPLLRELDSPPAALFVKGNLALLSKPQIAIVGSRNPSPLGRELASSFAAHFVKAGFVVTSGFALGIDAASHIGALKAEGETIAVLGNGLDSIYPISHSKLADELLKPREREEEGSCCGAFISEFPIGTPAKPAHFPQRNRIISGLSLGTLVVEAQLKSGSLITAKYALNQGREVFAIPGSLANPLSKGCHALIRQGAKLVESPEEVIEELGSLYEYLSQTLKTLKERTQSLDKDSSCVQAEREGLRNPLQRGGEQAKKNGSILYREESPDLQSGVLQIWPIDSKKPNKSISKDLLRVLKCINKEGCSLEKIIQDSQLTVQKVSSMLLELELKGYIGLLPGGYGYYKLSR